MFVRAAFSLFKQAGRYTGPRAAVVPALSLARSFNTDDLVKKHTLEHSLIEKVAEKVAAQFERGDFATDLLQDPAGLSTTGEGAGGKSNGGPVPRPGGLAGPSAGKTTAGGPIPKMYDYDAAPVRGVDIEAMRQAIASALTRAKHDIPHDQPLSKEHEEEIQANKARVPVEQMEAIFSSSGEPIPLIRSSKKLSPRAS